MSYENGPVDEELSSDLDSMIDNTYEEPVFDEDESDNLGDDDVTSSDEDFDSDDNDIEDEEYFDEDTDQNDESDEEEYNIDDDEDFEDDYDEEESSDDENIDKDDASEHNDEDDGENAQDEEESDNEYVAEIGEEEFNKYKDFYEKLTNAEFTANGKKVKGFTSVEDLIRSQQMSYGFSDKMKGFKPYRPLMQPLKDKGYVDNPEKFNHMMQVMDGDKEAIKRLLSEQGIDPVEDLDLEEGVNYQAKDYTTDNITLAYSDMIDSAKEYGKAEQVSDIILNKWDDSSVQEIMASDVSRNSFVNQVNNGIFDEVQAISRRMEIQDRSGQFSALTDLEKYNEASSVYNELKGYNNRETGNYRDQVLNELKGGNESSYKKYENTPKNEQTIDREAVEREKANIEKIRELEQYKQNMEAREKKRNRSRNNAASVSKRKQSGGGKKTFDPADPDDMMKLEGDDLSNFLDAMMNGDI